MTTLTIMCAWCRAYMGEKDGRGVEGTTHGMCRGCWESLFPDEPYPEDDANE